MLISIQSTLENDQKSSKPQTPNREKQQIQSETICWLIRTVQSNLVKQDVAFFWKLFFVIRWMSAVAIEYGPVLLSDACDAVTDAARLQIFSARVWHNVLWCYRMAQFNSRNFVRPRAFCWFLFSFFFLFFCVNTFMSARTAIVRADGLSWIIRKHIFLVNAVRTSFVYVKTITCRLQCRVHQPPASERKWNVISMR